MISLIAERFSMKLTIGQLKRIIKETVKKTRNVRVDLTYKPYHGIDSDIEETIHNDIGESDESDLDFQTKTKAHTWFMSEKMAKEEIKNIKTIMSRFPKVKYQVDIKPHDDE